MTAISTALPADASRIEAQLRERLNPSQLEVLDESAQHAGHAGANAQGFGSHFRVRIASPAFAGKSRVARHRLVYDALQNFIDEGLHALAIEIIETP
ncbi:MAG: BolA family protein [Polaromonas sp.]|uniref:BolA family protein n=1 Tax=Polaromonas sp. TaxID=1869339 RepID=UPI0027321E99|nr:BolA family protein [Polaromonas sp.]MDP1742475.1 BolA family protein [Polaromonas sp.]MDP1953463.1 BolA family protein [Polaromonas sp.]MDP3357130.1 BolA family protein [Polaromonas sp.]MDP3751549.1 BolA family protein [Polaromonas sp.]